MKGKTMATDPQTSTPPTVRTFSQAEVDELLKKTQNDLEVATGKTIAGLQETLKKVSEHSDSVDAENKLIKAANEAGVKEFRIISEQAEKYVKENGDLKKELAELKNDKKMAEGPKLAGLPAIGQKVAYFNHAGIQELGEVIGHGFKGVHLFIQGGHPNDKYERKEVEPGGPGKPNTFAHPPADKI